MHIYDILQGKSHDVYFEEKYQTTLHHERPSFIPAYDVQIDSRASTPRMPATAISSRLLIPTRRL